MNGKYFPVRVLCVLALTVSLFAEGVPALPAGLQGSQSSNEDSPTLPSGLGALPSDSTGPDTLPGREPWMDITGFWEVRSGYRLQNDKYQKDAFLGETQLQLELEKLWNGFTFNVTTDLYYDWVDENHSVDLETGEGFLDLREASVAYSPFDFMDVKLGRQVLTWGTGDLVFINDLFPKDWRSFLLGRDTEYLKAPSDALKASFFTELADIDVVYTPRFDSDRHITGERLSYWNGSRIAGNDDIIRTDKPDDWFDDDEWAVRTSKNVGGYELAAYGYWGFWKSPAGFDTSTSKYTFPKLNVYGASVRGQVGRGIGNVEIGYYDSRDDDSGDDPFTHNSQMRYLVGYERDLPEIASDFTVGLQYYLEQMLDYGDYKRTLPAGSAVADEYRHLLTLRVTKLYWNQNLTCSLFTFFSPSDEDAYLRPNIHYKVNDNLAVEAGANIFFGDQPHTFFGQFEDNTNLYAAVRHSF
ncbi:MAG: hypothetical protein B6I25_03500 [Planctomycetales bacterium 4572_13]|nr:MAG: hypothetical protein B6I25_03500 [Planctomycetales bacterium 4572_13]